MPRTTESNQRRRIKASSTHAAKSAAPAVLRRNPTDASINEIASRNNGRLTGLGRDNKSKDDTDKRERKLSKEQVGQKDSFEME